MSNLYSTVLKLKALNDAVISPTQGYRTHALFLNLLQRRTPVLASELHDMVDQKPFTVSPLCGKFKRAGKLNGVSIGFDYWIRLTFLREEVMAHLLDAVARHPVEEPLCLEKANFRLEELVTTRNRHPMCAHTSFSELIENARADSVLTLEFTSPTVFRRAGQRNVIFPEPRLVFGSLLNRWNNSSHVKFEDDLSRHLDSIILTRYQLKTHILHFDGYQEVGFEGNASYQIPDSLSDGQKCQLNALADFAFFCGTGAKTTMGMGQTRRVK